MLPQNQYHRAALCGLLVFVVPAVFAVVGIGVIASVGFVSPMRVNQALWMVIYVNGPLAAVGTALVTLPLPIRWWMRIAAATICMLIGFLTFMLSLEILSHAADRFGLTVAMAFR